MLLCDCQSFIKESYYYYYYLADDISLVSDSGRRLLRVASDRTDVVPRTHRSFSGRRFGISLVCMCGTVYHRPCDTTS